MKKPTRLTHGGRDPKQQAGFVNPPAWRGSTMIFPTLEDLRDPPSGYGYGRHGSPAQQALCDLICALESGAYCKLTSSGLNAITGTLLALVSSGDHILVPDSVYYPTRHFCNEILARMGVATSYYDPLIGAELATLFTPQTRLVFTESPGSHTFEVQDIPAITKAAKSRDIVTVMDNTWATPLYFSPLEHGVDISIHSATKYITGHSDALLGIIITNDALAERLQKAQYALGLNPGSEEVYSALKGLRTLDVRLARHQANGLALAQWLESRKEVAQVLHPALPSFDGYELWKRDFSGASGLFSIILKPCSDKALAAMLDGMSYFGMGWSWGGFESLMVPSQIANARTTTPWSAKGPLLRLHAGLEDTDDLIEDLKTGFERLGRAVD